MGLLLIYGMGASRLAAQLGITFDEAKDLMEKYFLTFPDIAKLMTQLEADVRETHMAVSPLDGRQVDLSNVMWGHPGKAAHAVNKAKNLPFQGCGASTTKLALCYIHENILKNNYNAKIIITVHDEILVEVIEAQAETVAKMVEVLMIEAFNFYAPDISMSVAAEIADHWIH